MRGRFCGKIDADAHDSVPLCKRSQSFARARAQVSHHCAGGHESGRSIDEFAHDGRSHATRQQSCARPYRFPAIAGRQRPAILWLKEIDVPGSRDVV